MGLLTTGEKIADKFWNNRQHYFYQQEELAKMIDAELKAEREKNAQRAAERIVTRIDNPQSEVRARVVAILRDIILNP